MGHYEATKRFGPGLAIYVDHKSDDPRVQFDMAAPLSGPQRPSPPPPSTSPSRKPH